MPNVGGVGGAAAMPNVGGVGGAAAQRWGGVRDSEPGSWGDALDVDSELEEESEAARIQSTDEVPTLWPPLGTVGEAETDSRLGASCSTCGKVPLNSAPHQAASRSELVADAQHGGALLGPQATRSRESGERQYLGGVSLRDRHGGECECPLSYDHAHRYGNSSRPSLQTSRTVRP